LVAVIITDRLVRHRFIDHKARLVDHSEVEATFVEAKTVDPANREYWPKNKEEYIRSEERLDAEVDRLKELGSNGWTEYQVLPLNQMLIDFLNVHELQARTQSSLADLEDFASDSSYRYDQREYDRWEGRIKDATKEIEQAKDAGEKEKKDAGEIEKDADMAACRLRAELQSLLEYVADYQENWASGSVMIRALTVLGVALIPILLAMGLLPLFHPSGDAMLNIFNWGLLGIAGAITAVLLNMRKSNIVEVGNTEGKKELRRVILGSGLGLVAGVILFSMIAGGYLNGSIFPNEKTLQGILLKTMDLEKGISVGYKKDIALSIFWGIFSGYSFEVVFDRMRKTTLG
jgi:hypothetical protein